jgi:hypothetical protein
MGQLLPLEAARRLGVLHSPVTVFLGDKTIALPQ